jgi:inner membrane protein
MPTVFTHIAAPLAARVALGPRRVPLSMLLAGLIAAVLPDADGLPHLLRIDTGLAWGSMGSHRGFTHTLAFALLVGLLGWWWAPRWNASRLTGYAWMALCCLSHPLLDMLTSGGHGIALWWPLSSERLFSPWRPVAVSPMTPAALWSPRGLRVAGTELLFIWLPLMAAASLILVLRRIRKHP